MDLVDSYFTNKDKDMKLGERHRGGDPQGVGRNGRVSMVEFHISLHTNSERIKTNNEGLSFETIQLNLGNMMLK